MNRVNNPPRRIGVSILAGRASPGGLDPRRLAENILGTAQASVMDSGASVDFDFGSTARTLEDMHRALGERPCSVLQVVSHGDQSGDLLLEDMWRHAHPLDLGPDELGAVLRNRGIRIVVLTACHGAAAAEALVQGEVVPVAIGIGRGHTLSQHAALALTEGFYGALARGETVYEAFLHGQQLVAARKPLEAEFLEFHAIDQSARDMTLLRHPEVFVVARENRHNIAQVDALRAALAKEDVLLFCGRDLEPGAAELETIGARLSTARMIIVLFDGRRLHEAMPLMQVAGAVQRAIEGGARLFPLYLEGRRRSTRVPFGLQHLQPAFLDDYGGDYDRLVQKLVPLLG